MPNPKLETYKNKATNTVYDLTDAAAQATLEGILDGTDIDSFGDVETALATKVDKVAGKGLSTNDYDNTAKGIVDNIQSNVIATTQLIKDTVGWSGKNKLKNTGVTSTIHNVTFTVNSDKSVTINGTASATIFFRIGQIQDKGSQILNGVTGGSFEKYGLTVRTADDQMPSFGAIDNYNGDTVFTIPSDYSNALYVNVRVPSGATVNNVTVYPMIRDDDILDPTYEPYFGSTAFPRSEQAVLGAKNLLPNNNTTQTINGIPFTKNADGSVTIGAGTASANTSYILGDFKPKAGNYILSRGTTNGQAFLSVTKYNGSTWVAGLVEIGNQAISEKEFTVDYSGYDTLRGFIYIGSGVTISTPYTVYPMVRLASDPDDTYVPHAMTNEELTDAAKLRTVTPTIDGTIVKTYKGGLVAYNLLTRVCTFGVRLVVGSYANYVNFMTGLPKAKSIYSFPCVCTNFARNVGMAVLTTSADGGMFFTGLGQAANFADGDELNISGSYIIADDVVS